MNPETPLLALLVAAYTGDRELVAVGVRAAADQISPAGFASFVSGSHAALNLEQHQWLTDTLREFY